MPYTIRKRKCKQSDGDSGSYVLSYKDKKGKKHRACHTSRKKARGQIAAIEAEGIERNETMKITLSNLKKIIQEEILNEIVTSISDLPGVEDLTLRAINSQNQSEFSKNFKALRNGLQNVSMYAIPDPVIMGQIKKIIALDPNDMANAKAALSDFISTSPSAERQAAESEIEKQIAGYKKSKPTQAFDIDQYLMPALPKPQFKGLNEALQSLKSLIHEIVLEETKKKKVEKKAKKGQDMDDDGDVDAADYKTKVYMAGGVPKNKALKMSRKFDGK